MDKWKGLVPVFIAVIFQGLIGDSFWVVVMLWDRSTGAQECVKGERERESLRESTDSGFMRP